MRSYHHSICIAVQLTVALVIGIVLMGCNEKETKLTKYIKDNFEYKNCISYYDEGRKYNDTNILESIVCYYDSGDTLLVDRFEDGKLTGIHKSWHSNGVKKSTGFYDEDYKSGVWKTFYEDGSLESYSYYEPDSSERNLVYQKNYSRTGELETVLYPIKFLQLDSTKVTLGEDFDLAISLSYSEYDSDSLVIQCIFDTNNDLSYYEDTVTYYGPIAVYRVSPTRPGKDTLRGILTEYNGLEWGGERYFEYVFDVSM